MKQDFYDRMTQKIIEALQQGQRPWAPSWKAGHVSGPITRPLRYNGVPYRGVNVISLMMASSALGFTSPFWMSYRTAQTLGGQVRKGEHGSPVFFASTFTKAAEGKDGEMEDRTIPFLKASTAFNANQIDGLPEHFNAVVPLQSPDFQKIEEVERYLENTGIETRHGGDKAFYSPSQDFIQMPEREAFVDPVAYYGTRLHEAVHATGHPSRLDRSLKAKFNELAYGFEEMVAEIGATMECGALGIEPQIRDDHFSYMAAWLRIANLDSRAIFSASALAQKAVDWLDSKQPAQPAPAPGRAP